MKKTLIAVAALAATGAFAQVTIKGTFDPSVASQQTTYGNGTTATQNKVLNNAQGTSQITFYGAEDLGGGMKASFLLENDFDTRYDGRGPGSANSNISSGSANTNFGTSGGEQYLALEGSFGKIAAGAPNTPSLTTQSSSQPFGTKIGGGFSAMNAGHVRQNNTVSYSTPSMSGFSAQASYSFGTKADTGPSTAIAEVGANTDIGLFYANGPLAAGVSFWSTASVAKTGAQVNDTSSNSETNAFVTYDFKVAKVGLGYFTEKQDVTNAAAATGSNPTVAAIDSAAYNVSVNAPLSAKLNLLASYGKKDDKSTLDLDRTVTAIGLKYTMSPRTSLYARYVTDKTDNASTYANYAAEVKTTLIGVQHNF